MTSAFTRDLKAEMKEVDHLVLSNLKAWRHEFSPYLNLMDKDQTWLNLPATILSIYNYLGMGKKLSLAMASIFKLVYLANTIHSLVKNDEEGQRYDQELQFNILLGDYLFGRILQLLLETGAGDLLDILAETICEVNEGMALKCTLKDKHILYIEKTRGSLYAAAFETGAHMAGKKDDLINVYRQLGYSLGMCLELINEEESVIEAQLCIQRSKNLLRRLNHENNIVNSTLEKGITELYNLLFKEDQEAAVM